jgi:glycosyltransferase involved in cell wall biosynthesis
MRVALIHSEAGPAARRSLPIAHGLRDAGHEVTFVLPQAEPDTSLRGLALAWKAAGFAVIPVDTSTLVVAEDTFPRDPVFAVARALPQLVLAFDVAWFFEGKWAMTTLRERRFSGRQLPVIALEAPEAEPIPASLNEVNQAFARSYAQQWADICFEPTQPSAEAIQQLESLWSERSRSPEVAVPTSESLPAVTVCVPYFEQPEFLGETLLSLARQTSNAFTVIVVDDGSSSADARAAFEACAARYAERGWSFLRQENSGAGAARNFAAQQASTEFLLFLDADDIAMPTMVERFLRAARLTGDECLVAPNYSFREDPNGPCALLYDPPGNSLVGSMADDMHGGSCIFVRRDAFQRLGGFTELRGVGFEDYEFHVRANLYGLRWDVLPEPIYRYRMPREGGVSRSTSAYLNLARVLRWYKERLQHTGLDQLPLAFASTYWRNEQTSAKLAGFNQTARPRNASPSNDKRKLLLLTCNFPFGMNSGWHNRVQQMIRYFGSRYELTLMTTMPREQLAPLRKQAFQHLYSVLGIEGSNRSAMDDANAPFRVREQYTDVFQAALRSLPTDGYDAALMDQVFMAEFRKDIDTIPVLTEHNIESRLLHQASQRTWSDPLPEHYRDALIEAERLERYEDSAWNDFPLRAVVSEVDRIEMDRRAVRGKTVVAANGADASTWLPNARFEEATALFAGHLAYLPNVDAIEFLLAEIWPEVARLRPKARLILAGRDPSDAVKAAVARAGTGVELVASPLSMDAVARRASISIAPLRLGSGTRCKILDSMAWGLPVVSTTLGAEGIAVTDEEHLLIRDDPQQFAEAIVRLLSDKPLWQTFRKASGELVREQYSWGRVFEPLNDTLIDLIP